MNGIITVLGHDSVGIIARVCTYLSQNNINILDISQTIVAGYFNMLMIVDLKESSIGFAAVSDGLRELGHEIGVDIRLQHEAIFDSMHKI
ncbi:MAG: ACT domain-containing protein [Oscillospiraceae bacterium]